MRAFVAGARTMIGAALVRRLAAEGHSVTGDKNDGDIRDSAAIDRVFAADRPQCVIVVGGREAGVLGNQAQPADLMLDNLLVVTHVISAASRHGVPRLLYLASSCIYPKHAPQPLSVESLWTGPLEPTSAAYAVAKLAGLRLCEAYHRQYGARFVTAIKADTFGPGDDFSPTNSHVVGGLMRRMHEAQVHGHSAVDVWGTGEAQREFIYVEDLADAAAFVMATYDGPSPINLGTGVTTSIRELAELAREVVGYGGELRFDSSRPDGMPFKGLDSAPLRALGWKPSWSLKAALGRTYESFLRSADAQNAS